MKFPVSFYIILLIVPFILSQTNCSSLTRVQDKTPPYTNLPQVSTLAYQKKSTENTKYIDYSQNTQLMFKAKIHWLWTYKDNKNLYPLLIFKNRIEKIAKNNNFSLTAKSFNKVEQNILEEGFLKKYIQKTASYLKQEKINLIVISYLKWESLSKAILIHNIFNPITYKKIKIIKQVFLKEALNIQKENTRIFIKFKNSFRSITSNNYAPYGADWNSFETVILQQVKNSSGGLLDIKITNPNAQVLIDNKILQRPVTAHYLKEGLHLVKALRKGFADKKKKILVTAFSRQKIIFKWKDDEKISGLNILSFPEAKKVYLAKTYKGKTPIAFPKILKGNYSLAITTIPEGEKDEYYLYNGKINFEAKKNLSVAFIKNYKLNFAEYFEKNKEPFPFWSYIKSEKQSLNPGKNNLKLFSHLQQQFDKLQWLSFTSVKIFPSSFKAVLQLESAGLPFIFSVRGMKTKEGFSIFSDKGYFWPVLHFPKQENSEQSNENHFFKIKNSKENIKLILEYNHKDKEFEMSVNGDSIYKAKGKFSSLYYFQIFAKPNKTIPIELNSISIQTEK